MQRHTQYQNSIGKLRRKVQDIYSAFGIIIHSELLILLSPAGKPSLLQAVSMASVRSYLHS